MTNTPDQHWTRLDHIDFWDTAQMNCALLERYHSDLIVSLAHGGMLSAKVTEVAWATMTGKLCPPIVYTNIGREKQKYYNEWCKANGIRWGLDESGLSPLVTS